MDIEDSDVKQEALAQFAAITSVDSDTAKTYLEVSLQALLRAECIESHEIMFWHSFNANK